MIKSKTADGCAIAQWWPEWERWTVRAVEESVYDESQAQPVSEEEFYSQVYA